MHVINIAVAFPTLYDFAQSSDMIAPVLIGGSGNFFGSVLGALILIMLGPLFNYVLHFDPVPAALCGLIAFGVVLIAVLLWRPGGLLPDKLTRSA